MRSLLFLVVFALGCGDEIVKKTPDTPNSNQTILRIIRPITRLVRITSPSLRTIPTIQRVPTTQSPTTRRVRTTRRVPTIPTTQTTLTTLTTPTIKRSIPPRHVVMVWCNKASNVTVFR